MILIKPPSFVNLSAFDCKFIPANLGVPDQDSTKIFRMDCSGLFLNHVSFVVIALILLKSFYFY